MIVTVGLNGLLWYQEQKTSLLGMGHQRTAVSSGQP